MKGADILGPLAVSRMIQQERKVRFGDTLTTLFCIPLNGWLLRELTKGRPVKKGGADVEWIELTACGARDDAKLLSMCVTHIERLQEALDQGTSSNAQLQQRKKTLLDRTDNVLTEVSSSATRVITFGGPRVE